MKWNIFAEISENITILYGDLSKDCFGLPKKKYDVLLSEIDEIYHVAAQINHVYGYTQLRNNNVLAALNLLKMLSQKYIKLNYVSTISACFDHVDNEERILESFINEELLPEKVTDGYSLTKWASERVLYKTHHLGFNINIIRGFGYNLKFIEPANWYNLLSTIGDDNALFRLASIYTNEKSRDWILKHDNISNAHNENYLILRSKVKKKVVIDAALLTKYVKYAFGFPIRDKKARELSTSSN